MNLTHSNSLVINVSRLKVSQEAIVRAKTMYVKVNLGQLGNVTIKTNQFEPK
jgi:hypothetical protein